MFGSDYATASERLAPHRRPHTQLRYWLIALLMYLLFDPLATLGERIGQGIGRLF